MFRKRIPKRKIPEKVQTNAIDRGPACLKAIFEAYEIPVSYGRLQEACHNEYDGTNIQATGRLADNLGMMVEEILCPADHLLMRQMNFPPALVPVNLADGTDHFVVLWRQQKGRVQVMDPATGRREITCDAFRDEIKVSQEPITESEWLKWGKSGDFIVPLTHRMKALQIPRGTLQTWLSAALNDPAWRGIALLDATIRLVQTLVKNGVLKKGAQAVRAAATYLAPDENDPPPAIPDEYWLIKPAGPHAVGQLLFQGTRIIRFLGPKPKEREQSETSDKKLSPDVAAVKNENPDQTKRDLYGMLKEDGLMTPVILLGGLLVEALFRIVEALVLRGFLDIGFKINADQRLVAMIMFLFFIAVSYLLLNIINKGLFRLGRHFESRLRITFLSKIPLLGDRYLQSHSMSDMADRCHDIHNMRDVGYYGGLVIRVTSEIVMITAGIIWIDPGLAPIAIGAVLASIYLPKATRPILGEKDMRSRTHGGSLSRFYMDSLMGIIPCRTHGADHAVRLEHESLLMEWTRAGRILHMWNVLLRGGVSLVSLGFAIALILTHVLRGGETSGVLLVLYWALRFPAAGKNLGYSVWLYVSYRNRVDRLLEPLGAAKEEKGKVQPIQMMDSAPSKRTKPTALTLQNVNIKISGQEVLHDVSCIIEPGSQVAIVGPSGAGKTSLVGLFLGWQTPISGAVLVDGKPLKGEYMERIRRQTAWVEPSIQLWNRSFLENLRYGAPSDTFLPFGTVLAAADLRHVVEKLPHGLQTTLGEGGGFLSGGEGQRVRLARGMLRADARLVILDEPFRGLDRETRHMLMLNARKLWAESTLLCVTHDVGETLTFERVLVVEDGRIVEDDNPQNLKNQRGSRYHALLEAEKAVRETQWSDPVWRKIQIKDGELFEFGAGGKIL